ncbi:hypothetical protein E4T47_05628 [Aureobasidium subglaciale]|nr:hypothetical protein E4T47_05628 [Aureobasidium subglaciale]
MFLAVMFVLLEFVVPVAYLAAGSLCFYAGLNTRTDRTWLCMIGVVFFASLSVQTADNLYWPQGLPNLWRLAIVIWVSHIFSVLYLEPRKAVVPQYDHEEAQIRQGNWSILSAYKLLFNLRLVDTEREAPDIIRKSASKNLWRFGTSQMLKVGLIWFVHTQLEPLIYPAPFLPFSATDFAPERQVFFRRLREVLIRLLMSVRWIWTAYYELEASHAVLGILFVIVLRLDGPEEWPTLFGHVSHASSIRGFWSRFWHRLAYRQYTNVGKVFSRRLLGVKASSLVDKLLIAACVFLISGLAHSLVSWCAGDKKLYMLDAFFFVANFVGCALEVLVSQSIKCFLGNKMLKNMHGDWKACRKCLGFVWVLCFFFWVVPRWQYPRAYEQLVYVEQVTGLWSLLSGSGYKEAAIGV